MDVRNQIQGFPFYQMIVLSLVRFTESIAETSLYPYIFPYLVHLQVSENKSDIPMYIAYLASANSLCTIISNLYWGRQANIWGRKPVLIIGMIGLAISMLVYGFAQSFTAAMVSKLIKGLSSANMATVRTTTGEVAHEKRHQSLAFSLFPLMFNFGFMIGPLLASSLITPLTELAPDDDGNLTFRQKYPFALPNVVLAMSLFIATLFMILLFEETHPKLKNRYDFGLDMGDKIRRLMGISVEPRPWAEVNSR
ncbi:unnamed protein product [Ambrosiozyma monospora]|uniref:Unnamed protein product n=1 Tax=Ambrosiozyma monospora TaxID=43982 RepID=A0ACB5TD59_AMBMO|nr:unnamed protein product [Ambrosiozyma monospora]